MSEVVRLTLVSHAMTDATAAGRFPTDEPLNQLGHRQADATVELGVVDAAYCGPEKRSRQTAELLGVSAVVEPQLADLDFGAGAVGYWTGYRRLTSRSGWTTRPGRRTVANRWSISSVGSTAGWTAWPRRAGASWR